MTTIIRQKTRQAMACRRKRRIQGGFNGFSITDRRWTNRKGGIFHVAYPDLILENVEAS